MLRWWTIGRAMGAGATAGLVAVLLWPIHASYPEGLFWPYAAMLAISAFCGLSILLITGVDLLFHRSRGQRLRPVRAFDVALGLLLSVPALIQLEIMLGG